jgi:hypothetical protein
MIEALFWLFSFLKSGLKNQTELAIENLMINPAVLIDTILVEKVL